MGEWDNNSKYISFHSNEELFCIESHWIFCINISISICCSDEKRTTVWNIFWILFFVAWYSCSFYNNIISFRQIESILFRDGRVCKSWNGKFIRFIAPHLSLSLCRSRFHISLFSHTKSNIGNPPFFFRFAKMLEKTWCTAIWAKTPNCYRGEDWWFPDNKISVKKIKVVWFAKFCRRC